MGMKPIYVGTSRPCTECLETKPNSELSKRNSRGKSYVKSVCRKCCVGLMKEWRSKNRDRYRAYQANWKKTHAN